MLSRRFAFGLSGVTSSGCLLLRDAASFCAGDVGSFRLGLARAAENNRIGETVLLSLLALGPGGPTAADPVTLLAVMRGLAAVGLGDEAWALAVDAVAASP